VGVDAYYTPLWLAREIVGVAEGTGPYRRIADFAAGEGSLLASAQAEYGDAAHYVATDADPVVVRRLRRSHPGWMVGRCDLFDRRSRRSSRVWTQGAVDLVLLNPPFSYRGNTRRIVTFAGREWRATPATAFVMIALTRLTPSGSLIALLPSNALTSAGDAVLWEAVEQQYVLSLISRYGRKAFSRTRATTVLVRIGRRIDGYASVPGVQDPSARGERVSRDGSCRCVDVVRGRVPVHLLPARQAGPLVPFVHTTGLRNGVIATSGQAGRRFATEGPFVVLPRVGKPIPGKTCRHPRRNALVLSDCVFAVRPCDTMALGTLFTSLSDAFEMLSAAYAGSCAPYLTVLGLADLLRELGWLPRFVAASAPAEPCNCRYGDLAAGG
jgi:hypothetical protein